MRGRVVDAQSGGGGGTYQHEHPGLDPRGLVISMIRELSQAKRDPQLLMRDEIDQDGTWLTAALNVTLASPRWNIGS